MPYWEKYTHTLWSDAINSNKRVHPTTSHHFTNNKQSKAHFDTLLTHCVLSGLWHLCNLIVFLPESLRQFSAAGLRIFQLCCLNTYSANDCLPSVHFSTTATACVWSSISAVLAESFGVLGWNTAERKLNSPQLCPQEAFTVAPLIDCRSFQICCTLRRLLLHYKFYFESNILRCEQKA